MNIPQRCFVFVHFWCVNLYCNIMLKFEKLTIQFCTEKPVERWHQISNKTFITDSLELSINKNPFISKNKLYSIPKNSNAKENGTDVSHLNINSFRDISIWKYRINKTATWKQDLQDNGRYTWMTFILLNCSQGNILFLHNLIQNLTPWNKNQNKTRTYVFRQAY